ncbi:MAG TPA: thioredoxin domain-containing protein [Desulfatiglandales bacterium]|nr:thioredoxin domain-containing protein [Desulfatiglandales bacterium]
MKKRIWVAALSLFALLAVVGALRFQSVREPPGTGMPEYRAAGGIPVNGMVTMVDLGSDTCIPCKLMAPIMEKVEKKYRGKAAVILIDVRKNQEPAKRFGIRAIPTQIFFDKQGKEFYRHAGFMSEAQIDQVFQNMGVS